MHQSGAALHARRSAPPTLLHGLEAVRAALGEAMRAVELKYAAVRTTVARIVRSAGTSAADVTAAVAAELATPAGRGRWQRRLSLPESPTTAAAAARTVLSCTSEEMRLLLQVRLGPDDEGRGRAVSGNDHDALCRRANWERQQMDLQLAAAAAAAAGWGGGDRCGGRGGVDTAGGSVRRRRMSPPREPGGRRGERGRPGRPGGVEHGAVTAAEVWDRLRMAGLAAAADSDAE